MKKSLKVLLATLTLTTMMATSAYAAEWIIDPNSYQYKYGQLDWTRAESKAQYDAWADKYVGLVNEAPTELDKVRAAVTVVSDYLDYDMNYINFHSYYWIRDHKGVCDTYSAMVQALLNKAGMKSYIAFGSAGQGNIWDHHSWNIVYVDGVAKWVDATWFDTSNRMEKYLIADTLWSDHTINDFRERTAAEYMSSRPFVSFKEDEYVYRTGGSRFIEDGGFEPDFTKAPAGTVPVISPKGVTVYITQEEFDACDTGAMTIYDLAKKYPELKVE